MEEKILLTECLYHHYQDKQKYLVTFDEKEIFLVDSKYLKKSFFVKENKWNRGNIRLIVHSISPEHVSARLTDYFSYKNVFFKIPRETITNLDSVLD